MSLSVIIICKNEESCIKNCLDSVTWADEIIVVDSYSTDATISICKSYTPHVYTRQWCGYGPQKNYALQKATKEWVLSLDADEVVGEDLAKKIKKIISKKNHKNAYRVTRKLVFLDKTLNFGRGKDSPIRLVKKKHSYFTNDPVHEKIIVEGPVGVLRESIRHYSFKSVEDIVARMNYYSSLSSCFSKKKSYHLIFAILRSWWTFFQSYFLKFGFLDGQPGLVVSISFAQGSYYRYVKKWERQRRSERS